MRADGRPAGGLQPERGSPQAVRRRRAALRPAAHGRAGDQGIGDFSALALAGEKAGGAGAAYLGVSPLHMLFPGDRERASPYHPSDRRFLDPILIDALDGAGLPRDEALSAALAAIGAAFAAASATKLSSMTPSGAPSARRCEAWFAAFAAPAPRGRAIRCSPTIAHS